MPFSGPCQRTLGMGKAEVRITEQHTDSVTQLAVQGTKIDVQLNDGEIERHELIYG
jgi:hypothetical protein